MWWFEGCTEIVGSLNAARNSRSSVGIVTERSRILVSGSWQGQETCLVSETSRPPLTPYPVTCSQATGHSFPFGSIRRNIKLTTHLLVVLTLRMSGVIVLPHTPHYFMSWPGTALLFYNHSSLPRAVNRFSLCRCSSHVYVGLCPPGDNCAVHVLLVIFRTIVSVPSSAQKPTSRLQFFNEYVSEANSSEQNWTGKNILCIIFRLTALETAKHNQLICSVSECVVWASSECTALVFGCEIVLTSININKVRV